MERPIAATGQQRPEHLIEAQSHAAYTNQKDFIICHTKKKKTLHRIIHQYFIIIISLLDKSLIVLGGKKLL